MAVLKKIELEFDLPQPRELLIDERTCAYIEKLKSDTTKEFLGPFDIKIDDFEGPLDLLLHLVKQTRVNIEDIFVSRITDQYLSLMRDIENENLEKASEFIEIAAILIEVKSKALLPKSEFEPIVENDSKKELIRRLEEYKLFKEAGEKMKQQETVGMFYKQPEPQSHDTIEILRDMTTQGLMKAMQKLFLRLEQRPQPTAARNITLDRFTVADKIGQIKDIISVREEVNFFELFDSDYSKSEIINTFQALLELLKMQSVYAYQPEIFGDIAIKRKEQENEPLGVGDDATTSIIIEEKAIG